MAAPSRHEGVDVGQRAQKKIVGVETVGPLALDALDLGPAQIGLYCRHHADGDLVLRREHVGQLAVVAFGPQMAAVLGVDQLAGDAHATPTLRTLPSST